MTRRLLDLFCGGGGAGVGYALAGWAVEGIDLVDHRAINPHQRAVGDALSIDPAWARDRFDAVHASPPCQRFSAAALGRASVRGSDGTGLADLIGPTRDLLDEIGLPSVIENVVGSPLNSPIRLRGYMWPAGTGLPWARNGGLRVERERRFECARWTPPPPPPEGPRPGRIVTNLYPTDRAEMRAHADDPDWWMRAWFSLAGLSWPGWQRRPWIVDGLRDAMGCPPWMTLPTVIQSIPPAYGRWLGRALRAHLDGREAP